MEAGRGEVVMEEEKTAASEALPASTSAAEMAAGLIFRFFLTTTTTGSGELSSSPHEFLFADHFHFEKRIGRSKTSEAWLVRSKQSDQRYCVKKITAPFNGASKRTRYAHEVEAVTFLPAHENVVKYFRAWQEDKHFFCQTELCVGGSFGACLERLPPGCLVDERDVWCLAKEIASGLKHVHEYGILHLDVKPDNVFLDERGTYKLGDFGVAYVRGSGWELQDGDGGYVAPEVLSMSHTSPPTPAADVFSLGATLYEAAAGEKPSAEVRRGLGAPAGAAGETSAARTGSSYGDQSSHALPSTLTLPSGRSDALVGLIAACLRRDPASRPSAGEIETHARETLAAFDAAVQAGEVNAGVPRRATA